MKFNITFSGSVEPKEPTGVLTEARAKIIWGEAVSSVRCFLLSNGLSNTEVDVKIKEFVAERNAEFRKVGIKNVIIGLVLLIVAVVSICVAATSTSYSTVRGRGSALGFGLFAGIYGLWKIVNGIIYLVRPQSEEESITEIE